MSYWWVNQNKTYKEETEGNFMWSPKRNIDGSRQVFYDTMLQVVPGDIVFSSFRKDLRSIGVVTGKAQTSPQPDFKNAGLNWSNVGWLVPVYYCALATPIRPKDHIDVLRPLLPKKYSPLQESGRGQQAYLIPLSDGLANALIHTIGQPYFDALASVTGFPASPDEDPNSVPEDLEEAPDTEKEQIIRARRGQGLFRSQVLLVERSNGCRVTKVTDSKHLRASHIKPWKVSTNAERLKGQNGLLLSPHIDHLFDQGYITFSNDEKLIVVPEARDKLLDKWGIDAGVPVGTFSREQQAFLEFHRVEIFKGQWP